MAGGYRSAWQECALIVSLEMFNILLERCNAVLKEQHESGRLSSFGEDLQIILPAVKVRIIQTKTKNPLVVHNIQTTLPYVCFFLLSNLLSSSIAVVVVVFLLIQELTSKLK